MNFKEFCGRYAPKYDNDIVKKLVTRMITDDTISVDAISIEIERFTKLRGSDDFMIAAGAWSSADLLKYLLEDWVVFQKEGEKFFNGP